MTTTKRVRRRVTPKKFFSPLLAFYNSSKQPAVGKNVIGHKHSVWKLFKKFSCNKILITVILKSTEFCNKNNSEKTLRADRTKMRLFRGNFPTVWFRSCVVVRSLAGNVRKSRQEFRVFGSQSTFRRWSPKVEKNYVCYHHHQLSLLLSWFSQD